MSDTNGGQSESEPNSRRKKAKDITLGEVGRGFLDFGKALGRTFTLVDGWIIHLAKHCTFRKPGWRPINFLLVWIGLVAPWGAYSIIQIIRGRAEEYDLSSPFEVRTAVIVIAFFLTVVPLAFSFVYSRDPKMSYCEALLEKGLRLGAYSLSAAVLPFHVIF